MVFGRVDVYWPDRPLESYRLNKATIAVGRSTGNDIVLDTTTISRYHITLAFKDQQVWLEDLESANGTYVDGVRVAAHDPVQLRGGEEIQIGEVRLIFHPPAAIEPVGAEEITQRVVLTQPCCQIELQGPNIAVAPGSHAQVLLKIENIGPAPDRYFVEIDGLPKGWARADRVEIPLDPGEEAQVTISIKPFRRSESLPGERPFSVRVRSALRPSEVLDARTVLQVLPYSGFGMALGNTELHPGDPLMLYVHNQGNAPLPLAIQGGDRTGKLQIAIPGAQLQLGPGERRTLVGTVGPRRTRWFGATRAHEFAIVAQANDASRFLVAIPGVYVDRPRLPRWMMLFGVSLMAVLALLVMVLGALFNGDEPAATATAAPAPAIASFSVIETPVAVGALATLTWEVTGAEALTLVVRSARGEQMFPLDPAALTYALPADQSGMFTLALRASNGQTAVEATATLEVRPLVTLAAEVLGTPQLVRSVRQQVRVRWNVAGAQEYQGGYRIWLEGSGQDQVLLDAPMPLAGEQILPVTITDDVSEWLLTLYAQGQDQVLGAMTQKLVVINPVCTLQTAQTIVRSGPGAAYPAVLPPQPADPASGTVLTYSPLARDGSGQWLMVPISVENRTGWVPLQDFLCANFDPQYLIVEDQVPPPPTAEPQGEEESLTPTLPPASPAPTAMPAVTVTGPAATPTR